MRVSNKNYFSRIYRCYFDERNKKSFLKNLILIEVDHKTGTV